MRCKSPPICFAPNAEYRIHCNKSPFLEVLENIKQFDWGDFFLFNEYPKDWKNQDFLYPQLIIQTDTTIRAVDDTYIYVYTPYEIIVNVIGNNYEIESMKTDKLENLEYPF